MNSEGNENSHITSPRFRIKIKENIYLIIPIITTALWALLVLWYYRDQMRSFGVYHSDLLAFRSIGYFAVNAPYRNYPGQWYLPISGYFFFIMFTIWPIPIAHWICFILNYISAVFLLLEFNKILKIMNVKEKIHRFLFLIIPANGWLIFWNFQTNSYKYLTGFIILLILRREMQWNKEEREKSLIYHIINYSLFLFILGWAPYFLYFFIIYFFYDIPLKNLFKKGNVQKYLIIILIFVIQNFLFLLHPHYFILWITKGPTFPGKHYYMFLLYSRVELPRKELVIISNVLAIILFIITLLFAFYRKLSIQQKFTYFSIFYILLGTFRVYYSTIFLIPLIMLSFIPFLIQEQLSIKFIKNNKIILLGLLSITLYCVYPTTAYGGLVAMFLIGLLISSILYLHIRSREEKYLYLFLLMFIVGWSLFVSLMIIWFYGAHMPSFFVNP